MTRVRGRGVRQENEGEDKAGKLEWQLKGLKNDGKVGKYYKELQDR